MPFYILNANEEPMCWDEDVLEFDTAESAETFLRSFIDGLMAIAKETAVEAGLVNDEFQPVTYEEYCRDYGVNIEEMPNGWESPVRNVTGKIYHVNEETCEEEIIDA